MTTVVVLLMTAVALAEPPSDFNDGMKTLEPATWQVMLPGLGSTVTIDEDGLALTKAAYLLSRQDWVAGTLECEFKDELILAIHCNGQIRNKVIHNGMRITLKTNSVRVEYVADGRVALVKEEKIEFDAKKFQKFKLIDDGKNIVVELGGKKVLETAYDRTAIIGVLFGFAGAEGGTVKIRDIKRRK